jgi:hypothetical protein
MYGNLTHVTQKCISNNLFYQNVTTTMGRAMAQAVSRRPLTAEAWVRSQVSPCGICGGQRGTGTGFSPSTSVVPVNFIPPVFH